jgi:hypothetical protein
MVAVAAMLLTGLPDRRIQATHRSLDSDIAALNATLMPIIGSGPRRVVVDLRGFHQPATCSRWHQTRTDPDGQDS